MAVLYNRISLVPLLVLAALIASTASQNAPNWTIVDQAIESGFKTFGYPGAVSLVADSKGILYFSSLGHYTYKKPAPLNGGVNMPMVSTTLFDMASCTKVLGATTAIAQFYQRGELDLYTPVVDIIGPQFGVNGKKTISVINCLLHNAGFPPDPDPDYNAPAFGCPETKFYHPKEMFNCQTKIYYSVMNQTLINPVGAVYVYSDLSFITLMYVTGHLAKSLGYVNDTDLYPGCNTGGPGIDQCYFEAYLRKYVFETLHLQDTSFLPPEVNWPRAAPCENDTVYLHKVIQGQVSDGNAYAMGGIAGHAGLFTNAVEVYRYVHELMFSSQYKNPILNATTFTYFTTEYNHSQSCRALGWSTNDPGAPDEGWDLSCGNLSAKTWTHIGYTGTQICGDPERQIFTVFLTNRVYPYSQNDQMNHYRQVFNNAVLQTLGCLNTTNCNLTGLPHVVEWKDYSMFRDKDSKFH